MSAGVGTGPRTKRPILCAVGVLVHTCMCMHACGGGMGVAPQFSFFLVIIVTLHVLCTGGERLVLKSFVIPTVVRMESQTGSDHVEPRPLEITC